MEKEEKTAFEIFESWNKEEGRIDKFKTSEDAITVLKWRYQHMMETDKAQCAKDTGLSAETVAEWWDGIDYCYAAGDYAHFHFYPNTRDFDWHDAIKNLILRSVGEQ